MTEHLIRACRAQYCFEAGSTFDRWLERCESPIERLFLAQCLTRGWEFPEQTDWSEAREFLSRFCGTKAHGLILKRIDVFGSPIMIPQLPVGNLRIDFAIFQMDKKYEDYVHAYAVELDGHDFHEKSKEQAAADKKRDRALISHGWTVVRFTGSEIFKDCTACLDDLDDILNARDAA